MAISQDTKNLIERMCQNVERKDFILDKKNAEECILKTYDLFDLPRPKNIVWLKDILGKFDDIAGSARSAWFAMSAWSAWSAGSARSAWFAWSAWSAGSARSAMSAGWTALDYDFDWFVMENEYCKNRKDNPGNEPNKNDYQYLEYCELLMRAKEYGLGYRVEHEDTLYLVPTPIVRIDDKNRFHSLTESAIRWKGGKSSYYISGVKMEKELWQKIANKTISVKESLALKNAEQRILAMSAIKEKMAHEEKMVVLGKDQYGEIIEFPDVLDSQKRPYRMFRAIDPSKNEYCYERTWPGITSPQEHNKRAYRLERFNLDYMPSLRT